MIRPKMTMAQLDQQRAEQARGQGNAFQGGLGRMPSASAAQLKQQMAARRAEPQAPQRPAFLQPKQPVGPAQAPSALGPQQQSTLAQIDAARVAQTQATGNPQNTMERPPQALQQDQTAQAGQMYQDRERAVAESVQAQMRAGEISAQEAQQRMQVWQGQNPAPASAPGQLQAAPAANPALTLGQIDDARQKMTQATGNPMNTLPTSADFGIIQNQLAQTQQANQIAQQQAAAQKQLAAAQTPSAEAPTTGMKPVPATGGLSPAQPSPVAQPAGATADLAKAQSAQLKSQMQAQQQASKTTSQVA